MQKLEFEAAWDKTIAPKDRRNIVNLFESTKDNDTDSVVLLPIRQAYNHRNDLLVIVLVHNFTNEDFHFKEIDLAYFESNNVIAKNHFSFPNLTLPARKSMPWTFIFPAASQNVRASLENGRLIFQ